MKGLVTMNAHVNYDIPTYSGLEQQQQYNILTSNET